MVQSQGNAAPTIAGLARAGGVGVETVRYYQRRGLLPIPDQGAGARRYGAEQLRRLRFIRSAQAAGFSLDEVAELLALDAGQDRALARRIARDRVALLDARITELSAARSMLQRLADDCAASDRGPCPILAAFDPA